MTRVAVVGGGIAGLAAAHRLRELGPHLDILILERSDRLGGKIHTVPFAGQPVEAGAEMFLMRDAGPSAALALASRVGLAGALVHPAPVPAALAIGGRLHPIPAATLMGVPADPATVADVAPVAGRDADEGHPVLRAGQDVAVGSLVRSRMGDAIADRLVDPLLGGVYAGRADDLSLQATMPGLHCAAQAEHTLAAAVRSALQAAPRPAGSPVFASVHGGLSRFVAAVAGAAAARVELGQTVRGLTRTAAGWRLHAGPAGRESTVDADAVVLAVPAAPAARLLSGVSGDAAAVVGALPYASVALVTLALPPDTVLPELSGFLVPATEGFATEGFATEGFATEGFATEGFTTEGFATEGFAIKAVTFVSTKWPHLRPAAGGAVLVRASLGRYGDPAPLRRTDAALVELVRDELPRLVGAALPGPMAARVSRWGGGLPQYGVGHVERVAAVREALPPSLALAGAAYDGVGIAACVRSGEAAAQQIWASVGVRGGVAGGVRPAQVADRVVAGGTPEEPDRLPPAGARMAS